MVDQGVVIIRDKSGIFSYFSLGPSGCDYTLVSSHLGEGRNGSSSSSDNIGKFRFSV